MTNQSLQSLPELEISQIDDWEKATVEIASYTEDSTAGTFYRETIYYYAPRGVYAVATNFHDSIDSAGAFFAVCATTRSRTPDGDIIPSLEEYLGAHFAVEDEDSIFRRATIRRYDKFARIERAARS